MLVELKNFFICHNIIVHYKKIMQHWMKTENE